MRKLALAVSVGLLGTVVLITTALANGNGGKSFRAELNGFNEIVGGPGAASTGSVSTLARGTFRAKLRDNGTRLEFTLEYSGIEGGTVTQAHPHFAQRHVGGGVFGFLCGGPKPPCPQSGTVTGTWTAADVIGPADQGVQAAAFDEFVRALRAGAVYVNVHSTNFPEGEIRGQINGRGDDD
jgi:CHRD domain